MAAIALLLLVLLTGCAAGELEPALFIDNFVSRSDTESCELVPKINPGRSSIGATATTSDSSFLVLYDEDRQVAMIGPDLEVQRVINLDTEGAEPIEGPSGLTLIGDTLLIVADQLDTRLRTFGVDGRERDQIHLGFAPQSVHQVAGQILVTPFVIGNFPNSLLYSIAQDGEVRALPVPITRYRDGLIHTFANTAQVAAFQDGQIVVGHLLMVPFAHLLDLQSVSTRRLSIPLPDGVRDRYGWTPPGEFRDSDADRLLSPVIAIAPDNGSGDLIYLTKTGRQTEGGSEKAIIRTDRELRYLRSHLLDINAIRLVFLAGPGTTLVATPDNDWFRCTLS